MTSRFVLRAACFRLVFLATLAGIAGAAGAQVPPGDPRPNFHVILVDEQGWNDQSLPMDDGLAGSKSDYYRTLNIECITTRGMRFSNAYAAAPMCGPSCSALHVGLSAARAAHGNPVYAAMTENPDTGIGMVLDKLRDLGREANTHVIYTSDHGQAVRLSTNTPLSYGKGTLWEGGMRVPLRRVARSP